MLGITQRLRKEPKISDLDESAEKRGFWDIIKGSTQEQSTFPFEELDLTLFDYNYDKNNDRAVRSRVPIRQSSYGSIFCDECYFYAGSL